MRYAKKIRPQPAEIVEELQEFFQYNPAEEFAYIHVAINRYSGRYAYSPPMAANKHELLKKLYDFEPEDEWEKFHKRIWHIPYAIRIKPK